MRWVIQLGDEFPFGLLLHAAAESEADGPFVQKLPDAAREVIGQRVFQRLPTHAALVELEALVYGRVGKTIDEQRDFLVVQHFDAGHIHFVRARITDVEGKEVHVIVNVAGVAIELGIAVDLKMLAGIEQ